MDRSVDSIGSCSLDVDADSTDFSDTSGELNFLTPNSAKDIQREFTAGIKERCKIPVINCQAVTTVLDPVTGNISTVLTTTSPQVAAADATSTTATTTPDGALPNKKPSYLNLACCVNGYSNLTTYDSKLRQDINKSREVSPSRPIIATLHYNRSSEGGGNFQLTAPTLSYISMNNTINNNLSNGSARMVNGRNGVAPGGVAGQDVTDNVSVNAAAAMFNGNGFGGGGLRTKVISSQSQISSVRESERVVVKKSFIQQRVEKLYGNAEGVVINKQIYSNANNSGSINERKYLNNIANENVTNKNCYTTPTSAVHLNGNGAATATTNGTSNGVGVVTKENLDVNSKEFGIVSGGDPDMEALPVMRHLRPEFRAQLQLYSPKKVPKTSPGRFANGTSNGLAAAGSLNGAGGINNHIGAAASNGELSHLHHSHLTNGSKITTNGTTSSSSSTTSSSLLSSSAASIFSSSSTSVATVVESNKTSTTTTTNNSSTSSSLSATTTTAKSTANGCDATGPTTAANQDQDSQNKSNGGLSITVVESPKPVTVQASLEVELEIPEHQQKQQEVVSSPKMKLSEPCAVNGGGVDSVDNVAIIRNGSTTATMAVKNGHFSSLEDKENINGAAEVLLAKVTPVPVKDGNHFLQVMKNEQNRLLAMAADIEREAEQCKTDGVEINEEVAGYVLVAAGKARLLCSQKMKQFEGLCHSNLNQIPGEKFQTTNEDLQGFWDMVMLQVNDVDASFVEIDSFRRNGWKKPTPVSPVPQARSTARSTKLTKRPYKTPAASSTSNGSAASDAAAAKREAQRKQLMELKRKQKLASSQQNVEIFVPGSASNGSSAEVSNGVTTS